MANTLYNMDGQHPVKAAKPQRPSVVPLYLLAIPMYSLRFPYVPHSIPIVFACIPTAQHGPRMIDPRIS
jgi:hypothetical protein